MKQLLILTTMWLIGCTTITDFYNDASDAWLIKYDPIEYMYISEIKTMAELGEPRCDNPRSADILSRQLTRRSALFYNYARYQPHNKIVTGAAKDLNDIVLGLRQSYKNNKEVSPAFCKIKLKNIAQGAESIQRAVGAKPR